jgi:hypothetical protein
MGIYLVDRVLPEATIDQLIAAQRVLVDMSQRFTARGERIRYLRSLYVPGESRCMCFFEAPDYQRVEEVNEVAKVPFARVIEVVELTPES